MDEINALDVVALCACTQRLKHKKNVPENVRSVGVNLNEANVIGVGIPFLDLLHRVVIVHAQFHVISAGDNPVLAHDKPSTAHRVGAHLKGLDQGLLNRFE